MSDDSAPYVETLPEWPTFGFGGKDIDGLVPVCRVNGWRGFQNALSEPFFNRPGVELIYRGHRRHEWQLTPTLGRYTESGVIQEKQAERQLNEFRYAMRGRGATFAKDEEENELWAYGQHHGLATPLLDWTKSPFVALFFSFCDPDPAHEQPNPSRPIFVLNETALAALDDGLIVQPMRNDHTRLINQAGLFTISPLGEKTLITHIMDLLAESKIDMDAPAAVAEYICKIHIPCNVDDRLVCVRALKMMNIHHGTLFPDPIGASHYCNEWVGSQETRPIERVAVPPSSAVELPPAAAEPKPPAPAVDSPVGLTEVMRLVAPAHLKLSDEQVAELAQAVTEVFDEYAGPDWYHRPSNAASLRVRIRRVLQMRGWSRTEADVATSQVLKFHRPASPRAHEKSFFVLAPKVDDGPGER